MPTNTLQWHFQNAIKIHRNLTFIYLLAVSAYKKDHKCISFKALWSVPLGQDSTTLLFDSCCQFPQTSTLKMNVLQPFLPSSPTNSPFLNSVLLRKTNEFPNLLFEAQNGALLFPDSLSPWGWQRLSLSHLYRQYTCQRY